VLNGPNIQDLTGVAIDLDGSIDGIFQNTGGNPALEGFYAVHLTINGLTSLDPSFINFINPNDLHSSTAVAVPEVAGLPAATMVFAASTGIEICRRRRNIAVREMAD
jgi:hypothetical protein